MDLDQAELKAISEEIDNATDRVKYELDFIKKLGTCLANGHNWAPVAKDSDFPQLIQTRKCERCEAGQTWHSDEGGWSETYWPDED